MAAICHPDTIGPTNDVDDLISRILNAISRSASVETTGQSTFPNRKSSCISDSQAGYIIVLSACFLKHKYLRSLALIHSNHQISSDHQNNQEFIKPFPHPESLLSLLIHTKMASNNPGNFANRPREEVEDIARKGGQSSQGGFASMDPQKQVPSLLHINPSTLTILTHIL